jgi:hypothetical protein
MPTTRLPKMRGTTILLIIRMKMFDSTFTAPPTSVPVHTA